MGAGNFWQLEAMNDVVRVLDRTERGRPLEDRQALGTSDRSATLAAVVPKCRPEERR